MSSQGLTLEGPINRMRVNDLHDAARSIAVTIDNNPIGHSSMLAILDRSQQEALYYYLEERLKDAA